VRYFCYVLVSIGWTALAGKKLGEGRLAAADCLDPGRYCPFDRGRNSKSVCLKAGLLGWCVLQLCGTVTVPYGRGVHSAQIHIHALDADKMVSTDPPAAPRLTPRIAPGRSPNAPFGQRAARGPTRCLSDPPHCAGKRADRPEGKSSRKTPDPHPDHLPHERTRTGGGRRRTIGAPCGRQSPADSRSGPAILAFAKLPWMHRSAVGQNWNLSQARSDEFVI
jgi:hypothetical protein